jgi:DNA-binding NtrC family response regulator
MQPGAPIQAWNRPLPPTARHGKRPHKLSHFRVTGCKINGHAVELAWAGRIVGERILAISEDDSIRQILLRLLALAGLATGDSTGPPVAILLGCRGHIARNDLAVAQAMSRNGHGIPIILITSQGSEDLAIEALRAGITNYFRLPLTPEQLVRAIEVAAPRKAIARHDGMLAVSQSMRDVKAHLYRIASCSSNVLITGETGTGKELAADLIHRHSRRAEKPLIALNCAAIPDSLLESELFGFERGAFTGAFAAQDGKLKIAAGGTVFLDEIGDLSPFAQAKVLRVIETGEIQRLGGRQPQRIDVRVIAATNKNLETEPGFRRDLYFRLNVARIHLPPLREHKEDILPLADAFRAEFDKAFGCAAKGFTSGAQELLLAHHWPGNIRELRNTVEAAFIDPGPNTEGEIDLPAEFCKALQGSSGGELERILCALAQTRWNRSRAAEELHWSRMTLYRKMARYKITRA